MTKDEAINIIGSDLGTPGKMPGYSFSLSALDCITGAKLHEVPDSVCNKCYAWNRAGYAYTVVKNAQARRIKNLYNPKWVEAMVTLIKLKIDKSNRKYVKQLYPQPV
ncbi:MAG TPA: hypothetical protein VNX68_11235 [Nitrosopumilaceae archaeon]|jgi:hypothetical protein|nr:hypothetical protein [Nitrosopumilaceae archaeon]